MTTLGLLAALIAFIFGVQQADNAGYKRGYEQAEYAQQVNCIYNRLASSSTLQGLDFKPLK